MCAIAMTACGGSGGDDGICAPTNHDGPVYRPAAAALGDGLSALTRVQR